jgi:uncharacterized membrane protein
VHEFYLREGRKLSGSQKMVERISGAVGRPIFLGLILCFVLGWIGVNEGLARWGRIPFDPAPFAWLQGIVSLSALLIGTVVLSKQNRVAKLAEQRAHLDLKVNLLTEQKAAKLIHLIEELRRDLPDVHDRHDSDAAMMQQAMNPDLVLATLDAGGESADALALNIKSSANKSKVPESATLPIPGEPS